MDEFFKSFLAGNVGGMIGQFLCFPFDAVKIRMQTDAAMRGRSMIAVARHITRSDGALALYRGLLVPVLGYGSINATAFGTNDWCKSSFRSFNGDGRPLAETASATKNARNANMDAALCLGPPWLRAMQQNTGDRSRRRR